MIKQAVFCLA